MLKILCKMNPLITKNQTQTQTQTRRGDKTRIHRFWLVWVHWGALAHCLEGGPFEIIISWAIGYHNKHNFQCPRSTVQHQLLQRIHEQQYFSNGLSYKDIKKLKIAKNQLFSLFQDLSIGLIPPINRAHISIDWCMEQNVKANSMDH